MPSIIFQFEGGEYQWHPNDYLVWEGDNLDEDDIEKEESFSFGFLPGKSIILGATFMRNFQIKMNMKSG